MNIQQLREDTPGCNYVAHFNNAGCSLHTHYVLNAVKDYLFLEAQLGGYELAALKEKEINGFYDAAAMLLKCKPYNIAFAHSATDAYAKALSSIPFSAGDVILTSENDYISNQLHFISLQKRFGVKIERAKNLSTGETDPQFYENYIRQNKPKLVSVTHVPSNTGLIQPVNEIGTICKTYDVLYLVDACQSAGQLDLDVNAINCDFMSATMRKFMRGPRGTGFLYVSDNTLNKNLEPMLIDMRGAEWVEENNYKALNDAKRFEYVELSYALLSGATTALQYALNIGLKNIEERNVLIGAYLREQLQNIPHLVLLDKGKQKSNIITVKVSNVDSRYLKDELEKRKINTSAALKKYALLDFTQKHVEDALRISPHYYNTTEEVDLMVQMISELTLQKTA